MRNALSYTALSVTGKVLKLVALLALARALTPPRFAVVMFAWGFVEIFRVVGIAGLDQWTTRTVVWNPGIERLLLRRSMAAATWSTGIAAGACFASALLLGYDRTLLEGIAVAALVLPAAALGPIHASIFEAKLRADALTGYYLAPAATNLGIAAACLAFNFKNPYVIIGLLALAEYVGLGYLLSKVRREFGVASVQHMPAAPPLRDIVPIGLQRLLWALGYRGDLMFLGLLASATILGTYGATAKVAESLYLAGTSVGVTLFPLIAASGPSAGGVEGGRGRIMLDDVFLGVISCACWGALVAIPVLAHLVRYSPDVATVAALFLSVGWSVVNFVTTGALFARSSTFKPSLAYFLGLGVLWILAFALWRPLGAAGVAMARLLMECFVFMVLVNSGVASPNLGLQLRTIVLLYAVTSLAVGGTFLGHTAAYAALAGVLSAIGALAFLRMRMRTAGNSASMALRSNGPGSPAVQEGGARFWL